VVDDLNRDIKLLAASSSPFEVSEITTNLDVSVKIILLPYRVINKQGTGIPVLWNEGTGSHEHHALL
jgi:hypothetical protein